jgi:uncharacterized Zn finger protein
MHTERTGYGSEIVVVHDTKRCTGCRGALAYPHVLIATQPCGAIAGHHDTIRCLDCGAVHYEPGLTAECQHGQGSAYD